MAALVALQSLGHLVTARPQDAGTARRKTMGGIRILLRSLFEVIVAIGASQTPPLAESGVKTGLAQVSLAS